MRRFASYYRDLTVLFYFDESGDYGFREDRFDAYVQAALICPDSAWVAHKEFATSFRSRWALPELHATDLSDDQLGEVAEFLGGSDCVLLAQVTDTVLISKDDLMQFRLNQAARIKQNLDWYERESTKARGSPAPEIQRWMDRHIKRAGLATRISDGEFLQAHFMLGLIADALQKSLLVFHEDRWRGDFADFHFVIDAKLPGKTASGEKYLSDSLVPALGSDVGNPIQIINGWHEEPVHPFVLKFRKQSGRIRGRDYQGVFSLDSIYKHGLRFERSHDHDGLQLVDCAAYVVRKSVLEPDNSAVQAAYDLLRSKLRNRVGRSLTIQRLNVGEEDRSSLDRYRRLYD